MKKPVCRLLSLLLCCVMALGTFPVSAETEISSVWVTLTAPAAGESPVNSAVAAEDAYTVESVQWSTDAPFEAGGTYQVQVILQAAEGNTFSPAVSGKINGKSCTAEAIEPSAKIRLTCDFTVEPSDTTISHVVVGGDNTRPVDGGSPGTSFDTPDAGYRVQEAVWSRADGRPMDSFFVGGVSYTVSIVLVTEPGYTFESYVSGSFEGGNVGSCQVKNENTAVMELTFTAASVITQVAVTGLTLPEKNGKPDFSVEAAPGALYTVEQVAWRGWNTAEGVNSYVNLTANDSFLPGHTYQVAILLKAKSGASFRTDGQNKPQVSATVNGQAAHSGAAVNGKEPSLYIMTGLDFTLEGEKTPIDQVTVTEVTPPSIGKKPSAFAKVPEDAAYTVDKVVWKKWDGSYSFSDPLIMGSRETFEADTDYQVTVILKAKKEAAFTTDSLDRPTVKATLNGNPTNTPLAVEERDPAEYIAVSYNFRTAGELITDVSILALEEPVKGKLPDFKVEVPFGAQYEIESVIWQWRDPETPNAKFTKMMASDAFGTDKEYQICVTLVAKEDAEFATSSTEQPQVTVKFNGDPAKPAVAVKDREPSQCVQVTFEFLLESDIKTVERVSVEGLDLPAAGSKPDMEADISFVAKYTVHEITWERLTDGKSQKLNRDESFRAGERYRVTVVLKAKEDAEFAVSATGRTQVSAALNGKTVVVSPAGSRDLKAYVSICEEFSIYTVIEGDGAQWTPQKETLRFRFSGEKKDVAGVKVDADLLSEGFYKLSQGSVVVELDSRYLSGLTDGKHQLTVLYADGVATTEFEVYNDGSVPPDREEKNDSGLWLLVIPLMVALLCGAIALSVFLRKKGWL